MSITVKPRIKTLRGDRNQCPTCGLCFNSTYAFDKHRVGTFTPPARRCLLPAEMLALGMEQRSDGFWVSTARPPITLG